MIKNGRHEPNFFLGRFIQKNHRALFYGSWLLLALIQSRYTELLDDEAYYWVYSHFPAWGYFDHPPMIALLIKVGYGFVHNELGVRLLPVLMNLFSLMIIETLIVKKNAFLFYAIVLSLGVLQISGFVAVPDTPLIFFTAAFFWAYKKFTDKFSIEYALILGVIAALLVYSKYHGVLIILFTLMSNTRLLTKYQTYLAGGITLLLLAPHLWWQFQHDWVSFRYQLFENKVERYSVNFTIEYIGGQILLTGPLAGLVLLPAALLYKGRNLFEKTLYINLAGIYVFFLLSSFRGTVEANWTAPVLIPLIVLSHQFLDEHPRWQKILFKLFPVTLILVLMCRVIIVFDFLPIKPIQERYHSWNTWPTTMKEKTKGLPIVFSNSYQRASKYWFYSGQLAYSQNSYRDRKNNYDFWPLEDSLLGKPVYFLDIYQLSRFTDSLKTPLGWIGYKYDSCFASFAKINVVTIPRKFVTKPGGIISLKCVFEIPEKYSSFILSHPSARDTIRAGVFNKDGWIKDVFTGLSLQQINRQKVVDLNFNPELPKGKYYFLFAINDDDYNATHNSAKVTLEVK